MELLSLDIWDKFDDFIPLSDLHLPCLDLVFPVLDDIEDIDKFLEGDVIEDQVGLDYNEKCNHLHDHSYASVMIPGYNQDSFQTKTHVRKQKTSSKIRSTSVIQLKNNEVLFNIFQKFNRFFLYFS